MSNFFHTYLITYSGLCYKRRGKDVSLYVISIFLAIYFRVWSLNTISFRVWSLNHCSIKNILPLRMWSPKSKIFGLLGSLLVLWFERTFSLVFWYGSSFSCSFAWYYVICSSGWGWGSVVNDTVGQVIVFGTSDMIYSSQWTYWGSLWLSKGD